MYTYETRADGACRWGLKLTWMDECTYTGRLQLIEELIEVDEGAGAGG